MRTLLEPIRRIFGLFGRVLWPLIRPVDLTWQFAAGIALGWAMHESVFVLVLVMVIVVHELGHWVAMYSQGFRNHGFVASSIPIVAGCIPAEVDFELMFHPTRRLITYASGVVANGFFALIGIGMMLSPDWASVGNLVVFFNLLFVVTNLLPLPGADGSQLRFLAQRGLRHSRVVFLLEGLIVVMGMVLAMSNQYQNKKLVVFLAAWVVCSLVYAKFMPKLIDRYEYDLQSVRPGLAVATYAFHLGLTTSSLGLLLMLNFDPATDYLMQLI